MDIPSDSSPLRVMLDTNILIAGIVWPRWSHEVLRHAINEDFRLVLAHTVIEEATQTLEEKFSDHTNDFADFLALYRYEEIPPPTKHQLRIHQGLTQDITDLPVAVTALAVHVDYFVSEDKDFTSRHPTTARLHQELSILLPGTFLREVMGWTSKELEAIRRRNWKDLEI